jgi:hypothetical protein
MSVKDMVWGLALEGNSVLDLVICESGIWLLPAVHYGLAFLTDGELIIDDMKAVGLNQQTPGGGV